MKVNEDTAWPVSGIVADRRFFDHVPREGHPESPRRLEKVYSMIDALTPADKVVRIPARMASEDEILLVHSESHLRTIAATAGRSPGALTPDTHVSADSYAVARLAVGSLIDAVRQVVGRQVANAFALVRPPGHHAERNRALGYCLFNNIAIAAAVARRELGLERILIVDWDVHHGNGTQHIFERDPSVLFFSTHQYPHFPKTGFFTETGIGPGEGYTINIALPKGYGDAEFVAIYRRVLQPVTEEFRPELILVSAGFDIHTADPMGAMTLTPEGFAALTQLLLRIADECCNGRLVLTLEGGYHADALAASVQSVIRTLSGNTRLDLDAMAAGANPKKLRYVLDRCLQVHRRYWISLAPKEAPV
jgi:acetoin utilization deacetylase AcuC-like enzyme